MMKFHCLASILLLTAAARVDAFVAQSPPWQGRRRRRAVVDSAFFFRQHAAAAGSAGSGGTAGGVEQASAAQVFAGAGPSRVDMNRYNLGRQESARQWTARLSAGNDFLQAGSAFLDCQDTKRVMVDTLKIVVPRIPGQGLGIELLELAGGRADGLGIVVVDGLVEGGCADWSGLEPGDSLSKIVVRDANGQENEREAVAVECLGYDRTVQAIGSLPPADEPGTSLVLTVKRLRRKPTVMCTLKFPPYENKPNVTLELFSGENLRRAMLTRGVKLNDPLARRFDSGGSGDCGADGTCATCTVGIEGADGMSLLNPPSSIESQIFSKRHPRWRMACKTIVGYGLQQGELTLRVNPRQWDE